MRALVEQAAAPPSVNPTTDNGKKVLNPKILNHRVGHKQERERERESGERERRGEERMI